VSIPVSVVRNVLLPFDMEMFLLTVPYAVYQSFRGQNAPDKFWPFCPKCG